jgi:hypothetical protein
MVIDVAKEHITIKTEINLEVGDLKRLQEQPSMNIKMVINMKDNYWTRKDMDKENFIMKMEIYMK